MESTGARVAPAGGPGRREPGDPGPIPWYQGRVPRDAIVQMFDMPFHRVERALPRLDRLGVSHVLVSPPQQSHPSSKWWARYQPVDFRFVAGPLGSGEDLWRLCQAASRRGMAVVADAVLNHMSNHPSWVRMRGARVVASGFPRFGVQDFHGPEAGRRRVARGARLPELRTDTEWVRAELRTYLGMLVGIGVRGFRFDAASHIEPDFFPAVLSGLPGLLCFGELIATHASHVSRAHLASMRSYDFPLAHAMRRAFAPGGDLRELVRPEDRGQALWGPSSIPFVNHHDLVRHPRAFAAFRVGDRRDRELAHLYVLGRQDGTPLLYFPDLRSALVKEALRFHTLALGQPMRWVHLEPDRLVWTRGATLLAGLDKSGQGFRSAGLAAGLVPGWYRDLLGGVHRVDGSGVWRDAVIPPRGGVLLVRVGD